MKLIIAGSRTLSISNTMLMEICKLFKIKPQEIVCGMANGIDKCGERFYHHCRSGGSIELDLHKPPVSKIKRFYANWEQDGKAAGPIRNRKMAEYADELLLIWDGESKGSANMKLEMEKLNKPIYEVIIKA